MTFEKLIEKITEDCFRFFGFRSFDEVDRLTFPEYELLCKAHKLSTVDKDMWVHKLAYLNFMANPMIIICGTYINKSHQPVIPIIAMQEIINRKKYGTAIKSLPPNMLIQSHPMQLLLLQSLYRKSVIKVLRFYTLNY